MQREQQLPRPVPALQAAAPGDEVSDALSGLGHTLVYTFLSTSASPTPCVPRRANPSVLGHRHGRTSWRGPPVSQTGNVGH